MECELIMSSLTTLALRVNTTDPLFFTSSDNGHMTKKKIILDFDPKKFSVSFDDFVRFLDGVSINSVCSHCGTDSKWSLDTGNGENEEDEEWDNLTVYQRSYAEDTLFRPYYVMNCNHCGVGRQFNAVTVTEWLNENQERSDG